MTSAFKAAVVVACSRPSRISPSPLLRSSCRPRRRVPFTRAARTGTAARVQRLPRLSRVDGQPEPGNVGADPAGGGEYLSTKLKQLRAGHKYSLTVAAGDLIGGSPFLSGLFHDEPSVESLNEMGLDVSSVGNHEFDEGVTELLRMQNGGCHPADGCYFPGAPYAGADFNWLAANTVNDATGETPLPPYWIKTIESVKIGFIGMTLQATDTLVAQAGIKGWSFEDEADTANALVPELKRRGVEAIVVLLHEGGSQIPPPGAVNACAGISGPIVDINKALDSEIDAVITGHTHLPYNCTLEGRIVTSAYSFGRVITEVDLVLDKRTNDVRGTSAPRSITRSSAPSSRPIPRSLRSSTSGSRSGTRSASRRSAASRATSCGRSSERPRIEAPSRTSGT